MIPGPKNTQNIIFFLSFSIFAKPDKKTTLVLHSVLSNWQLSAIQYPQQDHLYLTIFTGNALICRGKYHSTFDFMQTAPLSESAPKGCWGLFWPETHHPTKLVEHQLNISSRSSFCVFLLTNQPTNRHEWNCNLLGGGNNLSALTILQAFFSP